MKEALLSGKGYPIGGKHRQGPLKHSIQDRVLLPALPYQEQNIISHAVWEMWVWQGRWGRQGKQGSRINAVLL